MPADRSPTAADKFVIIRRFVHEAKAAVCRAKLRENDIESFISNAHTGTLIPFANGGFLLHVKERDFERAEQVLIEHDEMAETRLDEDFREADIDDIAYEKAIHDYEKRLNSNTSKLIGLALIIAFFIFCAIMLFISLKGV